MPSLRGSLRYWIPIIVLSGAMMIAYLLDPNPLPPVTALSDIRTLIENERAFARIGDLLAVAIAITGVTVPLIIVYRASLPTEIRLIIAETIEDCLASLGVEKDVFLAACADMREIDSSKDAVEAQGQADERLLLIIEKAHRAKESYDREQLKYLPFPADAKKWLLWRQEFHVRHFSYFHDDREDLNICSFYLSALVLLALLCLVFLYMHLLGHRLVEASTIVQTCERFLILATLGANFTTYGVLGWFVHERRLLQNTATAALWTLCPQLEGWITSFLERSRRRKAETRAAFGHSGNDDGPGTTPHKRKNRRAQ